MFVASLIVLGVAATGLAYAGARRRPRLLGGTALACAVAWTSLVTATIAGFSAD